LEVFVTWLIHKDFLVEGNITSRNASKNKFATSVKQQVVQKNMAEAEMDEDEV
jgi:hypothetical protein